MKLLELPAPDSPELPIQVEVPAGNEALRQVLGRLNELGWRWGNERGKDANSVPEELKWASAGGFLQLWRDGGLTQSHYDWLSRMSHLARHLDWTRHVLCLGESDDDAPSVGGSFCSCGSVDVVWSMALWKPFLYCRGCGKERLVVRG